VFQTATLQVGLELPVDMVGQEFALLGQMINQGRVVRLDELIEKGLLGLMAFVGNIAKAIPALCQHADCASAIHCSK
jgi:hypothetical protein